jgi:AraC-like DNA-binding protein
MSTLELIFRAAGTTLFMVCAAGLALRAERSDACLLLAAVCLGIAAFIVGSARGFMAAAGPVGAPIVHALCNMTAPLVWLLARAWLGHGLVLRPVHGIAVALYGVAMAAVDYGRFGWGPLAGSAEAAGTLYLAGRALGATAVLAGLWEAVASGSDDLWEPRRRVRAVFVSVLCVYVVVIAVSELLGRGPTPTALTLGHAALALGGFALALLLLSDRSRAGLAASWAGAPEAPVIAPAAVSGPTQAAIEAGDERRASPEPAPIVIEPAPDPQLVALAARAEAALRDDRLYRIDGLTIGRLAAELGVKEYLLRRAINRQLAYRNFTDFVNAYRLREASQRLAAHEFDDLSIIDIALEVGYASIGPFNRAFKARFGRTPSEFRAGARG